MQRQVRYRLRPPPPRVYLTPDGAKAHLHASWTESRRPGDRLPFGNEFTVSNVAGRSCAAGATGPFI